MEKNTHEKYNTYVGKTIKHVTHMYAIKMDRGMNICD